VVEEERQRGDQKGIVCENDEVLILPFVRLSVCNELREETEDYSENDGGSIESDIKNIRDNAVREKNRSFY